jgi:hypothetical protein
MAWRMQSAATVRRDRRGAIRSHHTLVVDAEVRSMRACRRRLFLDVPCARRQERHRSLLRHERLDKEAPHSCGGGGRVDHGWVP